MELKNGYQSISDGCSCAPPNQGTSVMSDKQIDRLLQELMKIEPCNGAPHRPTPKSFEQFFKEHNIVFVCENGRSRFLAPWAIDFIAQSWTKLSPDAKIAYSEMLAGLRNAPALRRVLDGLLESEGTT